MRPRLAALIIFSSAILSFSVTLGGEPRLAHQDFTLVAGKPSPKGCYPELVRVEKNGRAVFRLQQDGPVIVHAAAGEQIPERERLLWLRYSC
jgi:hypothetical protein